jgi:hypothetical protein
MEIKFNQGGVFGFNRYLKQKHFKCKWYHSLILGFPITHYGHNQDEIEYSCSYCGRNWQGKELITRKSLFRVLRG